LVTLVVNYVIFPGYFRKNARDRVAVYSARAAVRKKFAHAGSLRIELGPEAQGDEIGTDKLVPQGKGSSSTPTALVSPFSAPEVAWGTGTAAI
jgi:hypothetical protein